MSSLSQAFCEKCCRQGLPNEGAMEIPGFSQGNFGADYGVSRLWLQRSNTLVQLSPVKPNPLQKVVGKDASAGGQV